MDNSKNKNKEALSKITKDRSRTNVLQVYEQNLIAYLVQRVPQWMTSDMLTAIGFAGSLITSLSFFLAAYFDREWLLLGILGFAINWYGDSLDGRLAYYRNKPRKWYGFTLDFIVDWMTNILIGIGFIVYVNGIWEILGFGFVVLYGWAMMIAVLRYKIINKYSIDSSKIGPTEVRFILSGIFILEVIFPGSIVYFGILVCLVLLVFDIRDFLHLLKVADQRDKEEKLAKQQQEAAENKN